MGGTAARYTQRMSIWFDRRRRHFYDIPPETAIPTGRLMLRSFDGKVRNIDPEAARIYLISKDEAIRRMGRDALPPDAETLRAQEGLHQLQEATRRFRDNLKTVDVEALGAKLSAALQQSPQGQQLKAVLSRPEVGEAFSQVGAALHQLGESLQNQGAQNQGVPDQDASLAEE